uniref:Serine hydroxymethyltransferase-like domain-containing protein n=1 Tax=Glossina palpalis gambiensis TaxID=67801 RepID=A0A1B0B8M6_9MUSC
MDAGYFWIDTELLDLIKQAKGHQGKCLQIIASENFPSPAVLQRLSSCLHNEHSEGLPDKIYYRGNQLNAKVALLAKWRAVEAFRLSPEKWGC